MLWILALLGCQQRGVDLDATLAACEGDSYGRPCQARLSADIGLDYASFGLEGVGHDDDEAYLQYLRLMGGLHHLLNSEAGVIRDLERVDGLPRKHLRRYRRLAEDYNLSSDDPASWLFYLYVADYIKETVYGDYDDYLVMSFDDRTLTVFDLYESHNFNASSLVHEASHRWQRHRFGVFCLDELVLMDQYPDGAYGNEALYLYQQLRGDWSEAGGPSASSASGAMETLLEELSLTCEHIIVDSAYEPCQWLAAATGAPSEPFDCEAYEAAWAEAEAAGLVR